MAFLEGRGLLGGGLSRLVDRKPARSRPRTGLVSECRWESDRRNRCDGGPRTSDRDGRYRRVSISAGNERVPLADIDGPGMIQHIWLTVHPTKWRSIVSCFAGTTKSIPRSRPRSGTSFARGGANTAT